RPRQPGPGVDCDMPSQGHGTEDWREISDLSAVAQVRRLVTGRYGGDLTWALVPTNTDGEVTTPVVVDAQPIGVLVARGLPRLGPGERDLLGALLADAAGQAATHLAAVRRRRPAHPAVRGGYDGLIG